MDGALHVIGCNFIQETRVQIALDDVESTMPFHWGNQGSKCA